MEIEAFADSKPVIGHPKVDLFQATNTDVSFMLDNYIRIDAAGLTQFNDCSLQFLYSTKEYVDLSDSFFRFLVNIRRADGSVLTDQDKIAPDNLFFHSFINNVSFFLDGTNVSSNTSLYPLEAWVLSQLQNGIGTKSSIMSKEIYFPGDKPGDFSDNNKSYNARLELAKGSKSFEMIGKLLQGIFTVEKLFPPDTKFSIELRRSTPEFCLRGPAVATAEGSKPQKYIIRVEEAQFFVRKVIVNPKIIAEHRQGLAQKRKFCYSFDNVTSRACMLPPGMKNVLIEACLQQTPRLLCIGLTTLDALNGTIHKSPFHFFPNGVNSIKLTLNGNPIVYPEMIFKDKQYMMAYNTLCKIMPTKVGGNGISYAEFLDGNALFVFEINTFDCDMNTVMRPGTLRLEFGFDKDTTDQMAAVIVAIQDAELEIDRFGTVHTPQRKLQKF